MRDHLLALAEIQPALASGRAELAVTHDQAVSTLTPEVMCARSSRAPAGIARAGVRTFWRGLVPPTGIEPPAKKGFPQAICPQSCPQDRSEPF
ncbi:MAG: hypothetical protein AB9M60_23605 [Leptothrix sp. (in: b-proteobacteria)]